MNYELVILCWVREREIVPAEGAHREETEKWQHTHLHKVGEPHKVAVGVDDERGGEVTGLDEQEGRVHPEDGRVGKLK